MSTDKRITHGRHDGKLELRSRTELASRWLDAQVAYLEGLRDIGDTMGTVLDGLEQSGMNPLTLEPLRAAVEGLDHGLTLRKLQDIRATVHEGSMQDAAAHPKIKGWLTGAVTAPQAVRDAVLTIVQRIPQDEGTDLQALEGALPHLLQQMNRLVDSERAVNDANAAYMVGKALADAADISRQ